MTANNETKTKLEEMLGKYDMIEFLHRCKTDFKFFCNNVLKNIFFDGGLQPYMLEWFNLIQKHNRLIIEAPRGFAKTTILGVAVPLWLVFTQRNKQIVVISASEGQAKRVLSLIKSTIEQNPLLIDLKPKDYRDTWSAKEIKTNTNCRLFCKPFTRSILGERLDYVLMDEANKYKDPELYFDFVVPTLNPGGKIVLISSSESGLQLINLIKEKEDDVYVNKIYPAIVDGKSIWSCRFSIEDLENIEKDIGHQYFQKNFMCNPVSEGGRSIYTAKSIRLCSDKQTGFTSKTFGGDLFIGCDFAIASGATADFDAYVVIERIENRGIIKHAEVHKGWSVKSKVNRIQELVDIYHPQGVICDESSIGAAVIEELRIIGVPTIAQSFQSKARNQLLNNLKVLLDNGRLKIPRDPEDLQAKKFSDTLEAELLNIYEKTSRITNVTHYESVGAHDDTVMALAMAVKYIRTNRTYDDPWGIA